MQRGNIDQAKYLSEIQLRGADRLPSQKKQSFSRQLRGGTKLKGDGGIRAATTGEYLGSLAIISQDKVLSKR